MELETKSLYYPSHLAIVLVIGSGLLIFIALIFSRLWPYFFWFPGPWLIFWLIAVPKYILFDTVETTNKGIIIRHKNKNRLTFWINNVSVPWERIVQIRAISMYATRSIEYNYYLVLVDGTILRIPVPTEKFEANEIAERLATFLNDMYGQNVKVYRPPSDHVKSGIMVSRIDNINWISENIRVPMNSSVVRRNIHRFSSPSFQIYSIVGILMISARISYHFQNPTEPLINLHMIAAFVLIAWGISGFRIIPDENTLRQQYLDFLQNAATETSKTKQEDSTHSTGMTE